ncbi:hypothetical protein BV22DRAFT_462440 [Leucogyrophana mollusca]|uniref:Uncharacterized protein n=1 Tax=Leucogyrophana mollusca TaxID=85980 RepID=A0ACB8BIA3_9AGAM|nr:hypothetical protein BV22DRAFT_462440 [Leucogyrophana mollusca]
MAGISPDEDRQGLGVEVRVVVFSLPVTENPRALCTYIHTPQETSPHCQMRGRFSMGCSRLLNRTTGVNLAKTDSQKQHRLCYGSCRVNTCFWQGKGKEAHKLHGPGRGPFPTFRIQAGTRDTAFLSAPNLIYHLSSSRMLCAGALLGCRVWLS